MKNINKILTSLIFSGLVLSNGFAMEQEQNQNRKRLREDSAQSFESNKRARIETVVNLFDLICDDVLKYIFLVNIYLDNSQTEYERLAIFKKLYSSCKRFRELINNYLSVLVRRSKNDSEFLRNLQINPIFLAVVIENIPVLQDISRNLVMGDGHSSIYAKDRNNNTILHAAVHFGCQKTILLDIANLLVSELQGAENLSNLTPIDVSIVNDDLEIFKILYNTSKYSDYVLIEKVVRNGGCRIAKYLLIERNVIKDKDHIKHGANLDFIRSDMPAFFQIIASKGFLDVIRYLAEEKHIDINSFDEKERTAIYQASKNGRIDIVRYLLSKKADVCSVDIYVAKTIEIRNILLAEKARRERKSRDSNSSCVIL